MAKGYNIAYSADELLDYTLLICGKKEDKTPRFPRLLYNSYVENIINEVCNVVRYVVLANENENDIRIEYIENIISSCIILNHYIRVAAKRGWISMKQNETWLEKINDIQTQAYRWRNYTRNK